MELDWSDYIWMAIIVAFFVYGLWPDEEWD